ncbi:MAG: hypothetical protein JW742_09695, partial [Candidatus Aminicenantes bacterium]|nr:hypothetical protein [Candidatus Aminicenantes bacterium]
DKSQDKARNGAEVKPRGEGIWGVGILEKVLAAVKGLLTKGVLDFATVWLSRVGHLGLLAAAALGLIFSLIVAIRLDSFMAFLYGLAWVVLLFIVQYVAHRFVSAGESLIANNPSALSSQAVLDCLGLLAALAGLIALTLGAVRSIQGAGVRFVLFGAALFVLLELFAAAVFNPETISTETGGRQSAGREAIGIIVLFVKGAMRLVPVLFGIGIAAGFVLLAVDAFGIFGSEFRILAGWRRAIVTGRTIVASGLVPFLGYVGFVFAYLAVDVVRAILAVPEKLDALKK